MKKKIFFVIILLILTIINIVLFKQFYDKKIKTDNIKIQNVL